MEQQETSQHPLILVERGTLWLHVGGTLDFSTLEDKEASFDGTLVQMCQKGQLMVIHTLMSHGEKRIY